MKTGKLSNVEKMAIKGALAEHQEVNDIAKMLNRSEKVINNYLDKELESLAENIAKAQMQGAGMDLEMEEEETGRDHVFTPKSQVQEFAFENVSSRDVQVGAFKQLVQAGLTHDDANQVINIALKKADKNNVKYDRANKLFGACVSCMSAGHFINKQTVGGNRVMDVMSSTATKRTDDSRKNASKARSRSTRGAIYRPNNGTID